MRKFAADQLRRLASRLDPVNTVSEVNHRIVRDIARCGIEKDTNDLVRAFEAAGGH